LALENFFHAGIESLQLIDNIGREPSPVIEIALCFDNATLFKSANSFHMNPHQAGHITSR
jgi:hypothetical protein